MRILTVLDGEPWGEYHIAGSLEAMGHDVHRFCYGRAVGEFYGRGRRREQLEKNETLLALARDLVRTGGLDLIFCYVYDDFLLTAYAKELAGLGVPIVNYNVDMANQWYRQVRIAKYFTYMLCAQRANMKSLADYGARTLYFPMAGRAFEANGSDVPLSPAAPTTFVGSPTPYRSQVLGQLDRSGVELAVYGRHWVDNVTVVPEYGAEKTVSDVLNYSWPRLRHEGLSGIAASLASRLSRGNIRHNGHVALSPKVVHGPVASASLDALFKNSDVNLGFTRMSGIEAGKGGNNQVKLRDFEVPLAGGFYLVEEASDHRELYDVGREIETWTSVDELADKVRFFLAHPAERRRIAEAGQIRAQKEHTWQERFSGLFKTLGLH